MEEDRLATNLGPTADEDVVPEPEASPRRPKRRFVGRRAADAAAQTKTPSENIEDSGAIQGVNNPKPE